MQWSKQYKSIIAFVRIDEIFDKKSRAIGCDEIIICVIYSRNKCERTIKSKIIMTNSLSIFSLLFSLGYPTITIQERDGKLFIIELINRDCRHRLFKNSNLPDAR